MKRATLNLLAWWIAVLRTLLLGKYLDSTACRGLLRLRKKTWRQPSHGIYMYIYIYVQELASVHTKGGRGRSALVKSSGHLNNLQLMSTTFYNFSDA